MSSVRRSLMLALGERYAQIAISLLSGVIIARLLTPQEIGIYSVSLAVIGIAHVLRDFGIGTFLVQEKMLTEAHIRTAFGFSLLIGGTLALITFVAAPWIGSFYNEARMVPTVRISALNFVILPFCSISLALLHRDMLFSRMVPVTLVAALVTFAVTVGLGLAHVGPNSMAIGSVAGNIATGIGAWCARVDRKILLPSLSEWRSLLSFGSQSSLSGIVTSVAMDANDLIVGKVLGFYPVAILSRAQGLMNVFHRDITSAIRGVALPAFAIAHRSGADMEHQHTRSVTQLTAISWVFYAGISIYSLEALRLLAGPQWDAARPLVPIFCAAGALASTTAFITALLIARGRIDLATRADLVMQPLRVVLIAGAAFVFQTTEACAWAYLGITALSVPVFYGFKNRDVPSSPPARRRGLMSSLMVTLVTVAPMAAHATIVGWTRTEPAGLFGLLAALLAAAVMWVVAVQVFHHPLADEAWFVRYLSLSSRFRPPSGGSTGSTSSVASE